jgi:enoyl-[acyl-carrier protein] reductase I
MTENTEKETISIPTGNLMQGKKGLIMGVANDKSLAWGISRYLAAQGAELAFTFQGEALEKRVRPLAASINSKLILPCDVTNEASMDAVFETIAKEWGTIDFLVHAIGFSDKNELRGKYVDTSLINFTNTMNVSCYSFTALAKRAAPLMKNGGSMLTLTYYGAERVMPHYNVMGVAKAALEARVRYFRYILKWNELNAPLRRNTTLEDVGGAALYLLSELGAGTSGEVLHVDSGYHVVGMKRVDAPDIAVVTAGH